MNTVSTPAGRSLPLASGRLRFAFDAVRSITWREFGWFLFLSLLVVGINLTWMVEGMLKRGGSIDSLVPGLLMPMLILPFVLIAWAIADRADGSRIPRNWRLALGVMAGTVAALIFVPPIADLLGFPLKTEIRLDGETPVKLPYWVLWAAGFVEINLFTGLGVAVLEMSRRRAQAQSELQAARAQQVQLARELLESRLAVMQAQVEPHFLFDSLVDVLATYDRSADRGADVMDRLITYLRVALPRLRESGSTVQAEVDLLAAYLAVVAARHGGLPVARFTVEPGCANARFSPMLLLPLVQRAMRCAGDTGSVPRRIELVVRPVGGDVVAQLRVETPGLCSDDAELARVRDRLAGLYDGRSRLDCEELQPGVTLFTLCVPR
jgi:hypothetical protein